MKLKRKIFAIFLSCFLVISSTISSFAFAPVIALAPEIFSAIATTLVCAGVKFADYSALNKSVRDVYESEGFITKCLPQLTEDIKSARDGVVTLSKTVVDFFQDTFFPKVLKGENLIFSDIPCAILSSSDLDKFFTDYDNNASLIVSPIWEIKYSENYSQMIGNFEIYHSAYDKYVKFFMNDNFITECWIGNPTFSGKVSLLYYHDDNFDIPCIQPIVLDGSRWYRSGGNLLIDSGVISHTWNNTGGLPYLNPSSTGTLDVPIAGDVTDLVGTNVWNPSVDQVWNPSRPVDIPKPGEGDLVIPGDSIIDTPVDPPIDPPVNPDIPAVDISFSPLWESMKNIKGKFPFSLPWDIYSLFIGFDVEPVAPKWELPILNNKVVLDFSNFNEWANIVKFFVYVSFFISLIVISNKLKP